jgi:hypothetical protein
MPNVSPLLYSVSGALRRPLLLFITCMLLIGCDWSSVDDAVRIIQDTASRIEDETNDVEGELRRAIDLAEKLPDELRTTVTNELSSTINRSIAAGGAEGRCTVQFVRDLVKDDLERLIARLRKQSVPAPDPTICTVDPVQVDLGLEPNRRRSIAYSGYNFPIDPTYGAIEVSISDGNDGLDVSQHLHIVTGYQMVLELGPNGAPVTSETDSIVLSWSGRRLSEVPVIQTTCITKEDNAPGDAESYMPEWTSGDEEFGGNGPNVEVVFQLIALPDRVNGLLVMNAWESDPDGSPAGDGTTVRGIKAIENLYIAEPGWVVVDVVGETEATWRFRDNDHDVNQDNRATGPVRMFRVVGDTKGKEAGTKTSVFVDFRSFKVRVRQTGDCVRQ